MYELLDSVRDTFFYKMLYLFCMAYLAVLLFMRYYNEMKRTGKDAWKCLLVLGLGIWLVGDIIFRF